MLPAAAPVRRATCRSSRVRSGTLRARRAGRYDRDMAATVLDREEYIEQAYFFRTLRERLGANLATQDILDHVHEEILSTTRLPLAIQFLATELKHSGLLS